MKYFYPIILGALLFSSILSCGGSGGSSPDLGLSAQNCGNALINENESCDDGNINNSDGCNAHCAYEVGEASCGNGVLENDECCDDGNAVSGDGCSAVCTSEKNNHPPSAPVLATEPRDGATWSPTRLYLSWNASSDSDAGDQVAYDVYFILKIGRDSIPTGILPYKTGISSTHFIIQASTDNRAEYFPDQVAAIYLSPNNSYLWKVCARDSSGAQNCSETRSFNTDDSVVGWWRFDENPSQNNLCPDGRTANVCDYSGKGNNGVSNGGPSPVVWLVPPISGILGGALQFDGENDYVEIPNSVTLNPVSVSIQSKFKISAPVINGDQVILDKRLNGFGYELRAVGNAAPLNAVVIINTDGPMSLGFSIPNALMLNVSYVLTATYDDPAKRVSLYRDSTLLATDTPVGVFPRTNPSAGPAFISNRSFPTASTPWLNGNIDEVILYNKELVGEEVNNNHISSTP